MKFVVVTGLVCPFDPQKKRRPAVVLGMVDGRVAVAPCSTNPSRTGIVLEGSVLLSKNSPAHASTGFHADQVIINIRDAALYAIDSDYVRNCRQIGILDTELDRRFAEHLRELLKQYDLPHCNRTFDR